MTAAEYRRRNEERLVAQVALWLAGTSILRKGLLNDGEMVELGRVFHDIWDTGYQVGSSDYMGINPDEDYAYDINETSNPYFI